MYAELQHVSILTPDVEGSIRFYQDKLGMQLTARVYQEEIINIAFLHDGPASTPFCIKLVGPPFRDWAQDTYEERGPSIGDFAYVVDDLPAWHRKLRDSGVDIIMSPQQSLTIDEMYFRDICGNVVEMITFADETLFPRIQPKRTENEGIEYYLNHISMLCYDLSATEGFYHGVMGMETVFDRRNTGFILVADPAYVADSKREAATLEIMSPEAPWEREQTFLAEHGAGLDHLCYVVNDVEKAFEELTFKGVEFFEEPYEFHSNCLAWFYDPNGVQIELMLPMPRDGFLL